MSGNASALSFNMMHEKKNSNPSSTLRVVHAWVANPTTRRRSPLLSSRVGELAAVGWRQRGRTLAAPRLQRGRWLGAWIAGKMTQSVGYRFNAAEAGSSLPSSGSAASAPNLVGVAGTVEHQRRESHAGSCVEGHDG